MDPSDSTDGQGHADGYSRSKLREGCDKFTQGQVRPYRYGRTCAAIPVAYNPNAPRAYRPIEKGTIVLFILIDTSFAGRFERPRKQE